MKKAADYDYGKILPFLNEHPKKWEQLRNELGREIAFNLAQMGRDDIIRELRLSHKWSLGRIGKLWGMTRERARQIVNVGGVRGVSQRAQPYTQSELGVALRLACVSPEAWNTNGRISKAWLASQLGDRKRLTNTVNCNTLYKFDVLMMHGLGLDREGIKRQLGEWQRVEEFSYLEIAKLLSRRFVSIETMGVFKGAVRNGYKGDMAGAPGRARVYTTRTGPMKVSE